MVIHHYPMPRQGCHRKRYMAAFNTQLPAKTLEIRRWCHETFGPSGHRIDTDEIIWVDDVKHGEIVFDREENLMLFVLKWS